MRRVIARAVVSLLGLFAACREPREDDVREDDFASVQSILAACARCHAGAAPPAGFRTSSYYEAIGCIDGGVAVQPADARAPILAVLARNDHSSLLTASERERLERWVGEGARGRDGVVHGPGILDPRSDEWHGKLAAERGFEALRDPASNGVCGRCHEGAPVRPAAVRFAAPNAPSCTSCHDQPGAVLACTTCHGDRDRAYPPRDGCYFDGASGGAHAAHVSSTRFRVQPLECVHCHPAPGPNVFSGAHANGTIDVRFATQLAPQGSFDPESGGCTVACHARAGRHSNLTWFQDLELDCNSCHQTPPPAHYPGACATCHGEVVEVGLSLRPGPLHLNGSVDVGRGGSGCGACHGEGHDPWPRDALHGRHRESTVTEPIACESCHAVPSALTTAGHLDGRVQVRFAGRALFPGAPASYEDATGGCRDVACHAGALREPAAIPRWQALAASGCATCHAAPPPPPHVQLPSCGGSLCHGGEVAGSVDALTITPSGRALHIDGVVRAGR